jgi:SAM-dependent methyltransferase
MTRQIVEHSPESSERRLPALVWRGRMLNGSSGTVLDADTMRGMMASRSARLKMVRRPSAPVGITAPRNLGRMLAAAESSVRRSDRRSPWEYVCRAGSRVKDSYQALLGRAPPTPSPLLVENPTGWWDLLPFTTHQIAVAPERWTMASGGVNADEDVRTTILCEELGDRLSQSTVIDLGCLEGGFSVELARRGVQHVVGVEARQISVDRCNLVRDLLGLTNVSFRCADVNDELRQAAAGFDAVLATGILYHLPDPAASLKTIRSACRGFALVDTHIAVLEGPTHYCSEELSELLSGGQTYRGRTFWEYDANATEADQQGYTLAAYGNPESFWPLEAELVRMMDDAGFSRVSKIDPGTRPGRWHVDKLNRVMYLCHA